MNLGTLTITMGVDASGLIMAQTAVAKLAVTTTAASKQMTSSLNSVSSSVTILSQRMRAFGWLASTVFTAPILMAGKSVIQMGMDFEFSMAKIEGLVGMNRDTVKQWGEELMAMAPATATSLKSLADTLYYVSSSGFKTAEALNITKLAAQASATGMGEAKDVANFLTSAMNAYRTSGLTAARSLDILTAAVREGKGEPNQYAMALGTIVPIAAAMNVELEDVSGALAAMTLVTSSASNSATYLRNVLMKLMKPSAETEKLLRKMGSSGDELRQILGEQGLMPTLQRMKELTAQYGETMAELFPNIRAVLGALNLTGENMEYNVGVMKRVVTSAGDFQKAFAIASQTMKYRWNVAVETGRVGLTRLGTTIATMVLPWFEKIVGWLTDLSKWFNSLNGSTQKFIVVTIALTAALGPLALLLSAVGFLYSGMVPVVLKLAQAFNWLKVAVLSNPWTALAAVIGIVGVAIYKASTATSEWEKIQKSMNGTIATEVFSLNSIFQKAMNVSGATKDRADAIKIINSRYAEYLPKLLTEKSSLMDIADAQERVTKALVASIAIKASEQEMINQSSKVMESYQKHMNSWQSVFTDNFGVDRLAEFMTAAFNAADEAIKAGNGKIETGFFKRGALNFSSQAFGVWNKYIAPISQMFGNAKYSFESFQKDFLKYASDKSASNAIVANLQGVIDVYAKTTNTAEKATTAIKSTWESIADPAIKEIMQELSFGETTINKQAEAYSSLGIEFNKGKALAELYRKSLEALTEIGLKRAGDQIRIVGAIYNQYKDNLSEGTKETEKAMKTVDSFSDKLRFAELMYKATGDATQYSKDKLQVYESTLQDFVKNFDVINKVFSILPGGINLASMMMASFINQIRSLNVEIAKQIEADKLTSFWGDLESQLHRVIRKHELLGNRFNLGGALVNIYSNAIDTLMTQFERTDEIDNFIKELDKLQEQASKQEKVISSLENAFTDLFMIGKDGFKDFGTYIREWAGGVLRAFQSIIAEAIAKKIVAAIIPATSGLATVTGILGAAETAKTTAMGASIPVTMAATAAARQLTVAEAAAAAAWIPFPGNIAAMAASITGAVSAMAAGAASALTIGAVGLKQGGVIPAGYPNDTYPAMLSSGETVTPPGKLPDLNQPSAIEIYGTVKIDGRSLAIILRRTGSAN